MKIILFFLFLLQIFIGSASITSISDEILNLKYNIDHSYDEEENIGPIEESSTETYTVSLEFITSDDTTTSSDSAVTTAQVRTSTNVPSKKFTCNPVTDCSIAEATSSVPDPSDCKRYYYCLNNHAPSDSSLLCPEGQFFNQTVSECTDEPYPGVCPNDCIPYPYLNCPSDCSMAPSNVVAYKYDCATYFNCADGSYEQCLAPNSYFNGEACVPYENQCCNFCQVYCSTDQVTQIEDPCDCTSLYLCVEKGFPTYHSSCDPGYYFDEASQKCEIGTCTNICSDDECLSQMNSKILNSSLN